MKFHQYLARQLSKPAGIIGKLILGRLWNKRNAKLNEVTLSNLELAEDDRILDIGFGGGYLLKKAIPQVSRGLVAGLDVSPVMVENIQARFRKYIRSGKVDIRCGRAEQVPFPDAYFTKVSSVNSLFYWSDAQQGIAEIYRILQTGGRIVLTFTDKKDLEDKGFVQYGIKTYEVEEIQKMLVRAGFRDIKEKRDWDQHREFICITGCKQITEFDRVIMK